MNGFWFWDPRSGLAGGVLFGFVCLALFAIFCWGMK